MRRGQGEAQGGMLGSETSAAEVRIFWRDPPNLGNGGRERRRLDPGQLVLNDCRPEAEANF